MNTTKLINWFFLIQFTLIVSMVLTSSYDKFERAKTISISHKHK